MIILADSGLNDHALHGITTFSLVLAFIGFLCLSYDFLDRPHGLLRWLIQVVMPGLVLALIGMIVAFIIPDSLYVGLLSVKDIVKDFAVYGGVIGTFNGLFTHVTDEEPLRQTQLKTSSEIQQLQLFDFSLSASEIRQLKLFDFSPSEYRNISLSQRWSQFWNSKPVLRDGVIGFIFASLYWYFITILVFSTVYYYTVGFLSDYLPFAIVGVVGGIYWRYLHQDSDRVPYKRSLFSLSGTMIGLLRWSLIFIVIFAMLALVCKMWLLSMKVSHAVLIATVGIVFVGAIANGFSNHIFLRKTISVPSSLETYSNLTSLTTLEGGLIWVCYRLVHSIVNRSKQKLDLYTDTLGLVFWFVTWFLIWYIISFVLKVIPNINSHEYPTTWNLSQAFVVMLLRGTSLTVVMGTFTIIVAKCLFWLANRLHPLFVHTPLTTFQMLKNKTLTLETASSPRKFSVSSLRDAFIELMFWYEIWFAFGICCLIRLLYTEHLFADIYLNTYDIAFFGTIITVFSASIFRFIIWWTYGQHSSPSNASLSFFKRGYSIKMMQFLPISWLSIWLIGVVILLDEITFYMSYTSPVTPNAFLAIGSTIAVLAGSLVVFLPTLFIRWWHKLNLISRSKAFFSLLITKSKVLSHLRKYLFQTTSGHGGRPALFSVKDSLTALVFWLFAWSLSQIMIEFIINYAYDLTYGWNPFDPYYLIDGNFFLYRLAVILAVVITGALVGGFSRSFFWWIMHLPSKQLGVLGVGLTLVSFSFQLIEPTTMLGRSEVLQGHTDSVYAIAWSPDGQRIVSGSYDTTVQVWDVVPGGKTSIRKSFNSGVYDVAWSPKTHRIAAGSYDLGMQAWDADTGTYINSAYNDTTPVFAVAWSPDGKRIAFTGEKGRVVVWNLHNPLISIPSEGLPGAVCDIAWSPDNKLLATGSADGAVRVWNADTSDLIYTYTGHIGAVLAVAWSPNGKRIASGSSDPTVKTCDGQSSQKQPTPKNNDNTVQVWDATSGKNAFTYRGHSGIINDVAWSHDKSRMRIASASADGTAQVWDAASGKLMATYRGHFGAVNGVEWSPDDVHIATCGEDRTVQIWDSTTGNHISTYGSGKSS